MYIFNELPTAFPWYDKKEKQQRYRENAQQACDYRLISPYDSLLPFQIKIDYAMPENIFGNDDFVERSNVSASTGTFDSVGADYTEYVRTDYIPVTGGSRIHWRTKEVFTNLCAFYDTDHNYVSGVTSPGSATGNTLVPVGASYVVFNVSRNPTSWKYDKFVFSISLSEIPKLTPGAITGWSVISGCGGITIDLTDNVEYSLFTKNYADGLRVYYRGDALYVPGYSSSRKMDLPEGMYYSTIEFESGDIYFSEIFTIPGDRFKAGERSRYMKIEFWNDCDIEPIMYRDGSGTWKQHLYIDSFIHASEPEVEEDGERDGNDMLIPTFQRMVVRYRFSAVVPDFIKIALVSMQIHDNIFIATENNTRSGKVERMSSSATVGDGGAYSTLDVVLEQYVLVKNSCCTNMEEFITE